MLSYEELRKMVNDEKNTQKMQNLPEGFFDEVKTYLENKARMSETKEDSWEFESAKRLLQDLIDRRESKIVSLALFHIRSGADPGSMSGSERKLFDSVVSSVRDFHKEMREVLEGKMEPLQTIAMVEDVPEFFGTDERSYGPFSRGDVASIPVDNAELLVKKGMARKIAPDGSE